MKNAIHQRIHHTVRHAEKEDARLQTVAVLLVGIVEHKGEHHHVVRAPADDERQHNGDGDAQRFDLGSVDQLLANRGLTLVHAVELGAMQIRLLLGGGVCVVRARRVGWGAGGRGEHAFAG